MKHLLAVALFLAAVTSANAQTLGPEVVQNGGFDTGSGWSLGNGWQITPGPTAETGLAFHNEGASSALSQSPAVPMTAGAVYRVTYTVTNAATSSNPLHWLRLRGSTTAITPLSYGAGQFSFDVTAPASVHTISVHASYGCACVLDNVSIREIQP